MSILSRNIKEFRLAANLTQEELAEKVGVKQSQLCSFELGSREPKTAVLVLLANTLDVTTDALLGRV